MGACCSGGLEPIEVVDEPPAKPLTNEALADVPAPVTAVPAVPEVPVGMAAEPKAAEAPTTVDTLIRADATDATEAECVAEDVAAAEHPQAAGEDAAAQPLMAAANKSDEWWSARVEEDAVRSDENRRGTAPDAVDRSDDQSTRSSRTSRARSSSDGNPKHMTTGQLRRRLKAEGLEVPEEASKDQLQTMLVAHLSTAVVELSDTTAADGRREGTDRV